MNNFTPLNINKIVARNNAILQKNKKLLTANDAILERYRELSIEITRRYRTTCKKKSSF